LRFGDGRVPLWKEMGGPNGMSTDWFATRTL
jgi:hypothetical protein